MNCELRHITGSGGTYALNEGTCAHSVLEHDEIYRHVSVLVPECVFEVSDTTLCYPERLCGTEIATE
jgi:hypothetical protein